MTNEPAGARFGFARYSLTFKLTVFSDPGFEDLRMGDLVNLNVSEKRNEREQAVRQADSTVRDLAGARPNVRRTNSAATCRRIARSHRIDDEGAR